MKKKNNADLTAGGVRPGYNEDNVVGGEGWWIVESDPAETSCTVGNHILTHEDRYQ